MPVGGARAGLFGGGVAIPDSVVTRPADNSTGSQTAGQLRGFDIETNVTWPKIGGKISSMVSGVTRAEVVRKSDSTLMGSADISGKSNGDTFVIDLDTELTSGETYKIGLTNLSSGFTSGFYDSPSFPITSSDGDLSIVGGDFGVTYNIVEVGNVGF